VLKIIKVTGSSLSPLFFSGEYALIWRAPCRFKNLGPGDLVVFNHAKYGRLIKTVVLNNPTEKFIKAEGIHPASLSAETIGKIPYKQILGKVLRRIRRSS